MAMYLNSELLEWPVQKVFDEVNILHKLLENARAVKQLQNERVQEQVKEINGLRKEIHDMCVVMDDLQHQLGKADKANALYVKDAHERETASQELTPEQEKHIDWLRSSFDGRNRPT